MRSALDAWRWEGRTAEETAAGLAACRELASTDERLEAALAKATDAAPARDAEGGWPLPPPRRALVACLAAAMRAPAVGAALALLDTARARRPATALLERLDVNGAGRDGRSAVHWLAMPASDGAARSEEDVRRVLGELVAMGADLSAVDGNAMAPLHYAVVQGPAFAHGVRELIRAGADADVRCVKRFNSTPLHLACGSTAEEGPAVDAVRALLEGGASVDARTSRGDTPLHCAARAAQGEVVSLLLASGADPDARDNRGATPLHLLAQSDEPVARVEAAATALSRGGADVNAQAFGDGWEEGTPLHYAAAEGGVEFVLHALSLGANANARDRSGRSVLHGAAATDAHALVEELVRAQLLAYGRRHEGVDALFATLGASKGSRGGGAGAEAAASVDGDVFAPTPPVDFNARDKWGNTAMHVAAHKSRSTQVLRVMCAARDPCVLPRMATSHSQRGSHGVTS